MLQVLRPDQIVRLKAERLRRGWSQLDLAFRSRVQPTDISRIERGRALPYPGQAARLAAALDLSESDLLTPVAAAPSTDEDA